MRTSGAATKARKRLGEIDQALAKNQRAFQVDAIDEELLIGINRPLLEEKARRFDHNFQEQCVCARDYERLEMYVMELLMKG
jgi:hypothetical protein